MMHLSTAERLQKVAGGKRLARHPRKPIQFIFPAPALAGERGGPQNV